MKKWINKVGELALYFFAAVALLEAVYLSFGVMWGEASITYGDAAISGAITLAFCAVFGTLAAIGLLFGRPRRTK